MDDGGGLENRYAGDCIVGSNPTPSAIKLLDFKLDWIRMRLVILFVCHNVSH